MIFGLAGFFLGTVLGSFIKVLADRSLEGKSFGGRSYCPECQHKLAWYDLLPIFSFIFLKGRCRYCSKRFGREYVVTEIAMGVLIGFLFWQSFSSFQFPVSSFQSIFNFQFSILVLDLIFKAFFIAVLAVLFLTDLRKMIIPDRIVKPAIFLGIASLILLAIYKVSYLYYYLSLSPIGKNLLPPSSDYFQRHAFIIAQPFLLSLLTALLIGGFFMALIKITKGKGMGGGDVKLGAFMGVMLGFPGAVLALAIAFFTGAVFGLSLVVSGKKTFKAAIPFGPFLVIGSLVTLFWGRQIIDWYLTLGT